MVNRLIQPFFAFVDATGAPRENYRLFFYAANTSTKLNTYSATDLTLNANPLTLNSLGQCPTDVYGQDLAYDIVLASPGSNDPPTGSEVATYVDASTSDFTARAKLTGYNGNPNTHVAGTAATGSTAADTIFDYANGILYVCTTTGVAAAAVWTGVNASSAINVIPVPQGRLSLTSGAPVMASEQAAVTAVYYTPYFGNLCPIYNGSIFVPTVFTERQLVLVASHLASTIYDVFLFSDSGVVTVGTGPAWSNSAATTSARGSGGGSTELTRLGGLLVNAVQITARNGSTTYTVPANRATYLGSIFMDGTNGQITCHLSWGQNRKWGVWNAYNRVPIVLKAGDGTASWSYNTATIRQSNGAAGNKITVFAGLPESRFSINLRQKVKVLTAAGGASEISLSMGIGVNSTTVYSAASTHGVDRNASIALASYDEVTAFLVVYPAIGINNINSLEAGAGGETQTFFGSEGTMCLQAEWDG